MEWGKILLLVGFVIELSEGNLWVFESLFSCGVSILLPGAWCLVPWVEFVIVLGEYHRNSEVNKSCSDALNTSL